MFLFDVCLSECLCAADQLIGIRQMHNIIEIGLPNATESTFGKHVPIDSADMTS